MSYAVSGKLMGYGPGAFGFSGLGDAAYDSALQAYNADHAQWVLDKQAYDRAYTAWQAQSANALAAYNQALAAYNANLANWQMEQAAYTGQLAAYQNQARTNAMTYGMSQNSVLAQYPSIVIPAGYAGCVTQAQHDAWAKTCSQIQSVKGLGGPTPTGPACGLALLPVCAAPLSAPPPLRPRPVPPPLPNPSLSPAPVRPEPLPPAPPASPLPLPASNQPGSPPPSVLTPSYTVPDSLPVPPPSTTPTTTSASAGLLSNGLLLVILAGGGYALYRTFKKPKKAA